MADKTLVYQSYRTVEPGSWIDRCLISVREWATVRGYAYLFLGDELFDPVPGWYRQRCGTEILPVTDLARLLQAVRFLREGWDRVIWVDADVLVFAPQRFVVDDRWSFALCHEIRIAPGKDRRVRTVEGVNNCVSLYRRGNPFLQFQIFACQSIVANASQPIGFLDAGTRPLTGLGRHVPLPLLTTVGLFTPRILEDIVAGGGQFLRAHAEARKGPVYAANLCHSATLPGRRLVPLAGNVFLDAIERLVETRGAIVNDVSTVDSKSAPQ